jgi:hypothetical protein
VGDALERLGCRSVGGDVVVRGYGIHRAPWRHRRQRSGYERKRIRVRRLQRFQRGRLGERVVVDWFFERLLGKRQQWRHERREQHERQRGLVERKQRELGFE